MAYSFSYFLFTFAFFFWSFRITVNCVKVTEENGERWYVLPKRALMIAECYLDQTDFCPGILAEGDDWTLLEDGDTKTLSVKGTTMKHDDLVLNWLAIGEFNRSVAGVGEDVDKVCLSFDYKLSNDSIPLQYTLYYDYLNRTDRWAGFGGQYNITQNNDNNNGGYRKQMVDISLDGGEDHYIWTVLLYPVMTRNDSEFSIANIELTRNSCRWREAARRYTTNTALESSKLRHFYWLVPKPENKLRSAVLKRVQLQQRGQ